jgi:hypothetical protein
LNKLYPFLAFFILLLVPVWAQNAFADTFTIEPGCTSNTPGCFWNEDSTWQGTGVPTVAHGDTAIIISGTYVFTHEPQMGEGELADIVIVNTGGNLVITESFNPNTQIIGNTLTNNGVVTLDPGSTIKLKFTGSNPKINGNGVLQIIDNNNLAQNAIITVDDPSKTLINEAGHTISITKSGDAVLIPGKVGSVDNKGTIVVREGILELNPGSPFDNHGTLRIRGDLTIPGEVIFSSSLSGEENDVFNNYGLVDLFNGGKFFNYRLFVNQCGGLVSPSLSDIIIPQPNTGLIQEIVCPPEPQPEIIGGTIIPIESTSLILAGAQTFSWMIPVLLSGIGIGLFVVSRKSENSYFRESIL